VNILNGVLKFVKERVILKIKDKIKNFWSEFKKHWLWVSIGSYIGATMISWLEYFLGSMNLWVAMGVTFITPIILFILYYIRKSKYQRNIYKGIWIVGGGLSLGWPIWMFISYFFIVAPWAPFYESQGTLKDIIFILTIMPSYSLAAYIMYRLGKKRDFRPFM